MNKYKTMMGMGIIIVSLIIIAILMFLVVYFPITQIIIMNIIGPIFMLVLFVGIFLFFSGIFQKDVKNNFVEKKNKE